MKKKQHRVTVAEVLAAYKKTRLKPRRVVMRSGKFACALGALCRASAGKHKRPSPWQWAIDRYGPKYAWGFVNGFDGGKMLPHDSLLGYRDGQRVAEAVFAPK